ncbi:MAG: hypothetical protein ACJASQ_003015 [Crocinitomicaceae bacterium]|jgi:hypothetical protein
MIKYIVVTMGTMFICMPFILLPLPPGVLIGGFLSIVIIGPICLAIAIKRISSKEEIRLSADQIGSATFGQIRLDSIKSYKVLSFRGATSLVFKLVDNRKLTIAPRKTTSISAEAEFQEFLKKFKKHMVAVTNRVDGSAR